MKLGDDYEPSSDLLAFLATLPSDLVSGVPKDTAVPDPVKVEDSVGKSCILKLNLRKFWNAAQPMNTALPMSFWPHSQHYHPSL